jgi:hypothetical protein
MAKTISCTNCQAPLKVEINQPLVVCEYCGYQVKQTVAMETAPKPQPQPQPPAIPFRVPEDVVARTSINVEDLRARGRRTVLIVILATTVFPIVLAVGIPIATHQCSVKKKATRDLTRLGAMASEPDADQQLAAKLGAFSACLNDFSSNVQSSRERYLAWVDERLGPDCSSSCVSWGLQPVYLHNNNCEEGLKNTRSLPPSLPQVEQAGAALVEAVKTLAATTARAHKYYNQGDYKDDSCAGAKKLHPELLIGFAAYERAEAILRAVLDKEIPALLARRLEHARRRDPQGMIAAYSKTLADARQLVDAIRVLHDGTRTDSDLAGARALITRFDEDLTATVQAEARDPQHGKMDYFLWPYTFEGHLKSDGLELLKAAKEHVRDIGKPAPRYYSRHSDTYVQVFEKYNSFLRYAKGAGPQLRLPPDRTRCGR